jgi:hypothetical protein
MIDRYTKAVLTLIALALVALAVEQGIGRASAEFQCGTPDTPCFVEASSPYGMLVHIDRR